MASNDVSMNIHDYGVPVVVDKKEKVKCNYCGKEVTGFHRLKCHIGGVGKDVTHCPEAPSNIKHLFNKLLLEGKRRKLAKEVDHHHLEHPNLCLKRVLEPALDISEGVKRIKRVAKKPKRVPRKRVAKPKMKAPKPPANEYVNPFRESWSRTGCSLVVEHWVDKRGRELVNFSVDCPKGEFHIRCQDISAFADDDDDDDIDACWKTLLQEVIKEVGEQNVVQIITASKKNPMLLAITQIVEQQQHRNITWAFSASHCIGMVLQHMGTVDPFGEVLNKGKEMTDFIHGHETMLKLFRVYSGGHDLAKPHRISSVKRLLTLENIVTQKQNLKQMFDSPAWADSPWADSTEGKRASDLLISDHSFWERAVMLLDVTRPFVRMLSPINNGTASGKNNNKLKVGYIYESFKQAKEDIRNQLIGNTTYKYMPFWKAIDEIWDVYLHKPLHSAGYYLNPYLSFSGKLIKNNDSEVEAGLKWCIDNIVDDDPGVRALISKQLEQYELAAIDSSTFEYGRSWLKANPENSPEEWWFQCGKDWPELQKFAVRVLSQTCDGVLSYDVRRSLAKRLSQTKGIILRTNNL